MGSLPLRWRSALFESLVRFAPDALLVVDADGEIVFANATVQTLFGFSPEELLELGIEGLAPERLRPAYCRLRRRYMHQSTIRDMGSAAAEVLAVRKDDTEFPVEIRLSPIEVSGTTLIAAVVRDVTERWRTAHAARTAREEAERANVAKGRFLAAASHDLRQPLQTLQMLNGALQAQEHTPATQELLAEQHNSLVAMSRLINALLDISKLETGHVQPECESVSLLELFDELRREFTSIAAARGLALSVMTDPHYIRTDRTLLRQLLENLLANAIKYTETGGVDLRCTSHEQGILICVSDTGVGIADNQLTSIFEEFYQIDRKDQRHGVGLGLAIVKRLVTLLGLKIEVESALGRGSKFRIAVPRDHILRMAPLQSPARPAQSPLSSKALVLLVEDDRAVRNATEFYLKAIGHTTITADSLAGAEQSLRSAAREPDLIISDYHLGPNESGIDLIQRIRTQVGKMLPALLLSGDTSTAMHEISETGAFELLSKPVDIAVLNHTIAKLLSH